MMLCVYAIIIIIIWNATKCAGKRRASMSEGNDLEVSGLLSSEHRQTSVEIQSAQMEEEESETARLA